MNEILTKRRVIPCTWRGAYTDPSMGLMQNVEKLKFVHKNERKTILTCPTSPPGGNQVDGLPPAFN